MSSRTIKAQLDSFPYATARPVPDFRGFGSALSAITRHLEPQEPPPRSQEPKEPPLWLLPAVGGHPPGKSCKVGECLDQGRLLQLVVQVPGEAATAGAERLSGSDRDLPGLRASALTEELHCSYYYY
jgi:hypothetical protein